jgi:hypothetical protein
MTTTPVRLLNELTKRDGHVSVWTGCDVDTLVPQHRQGGMGGGASKQRLSNLLWLESDINGLIESDAAFAAEARRRGIKISLHDDPEAVPVTHAAHGLRCLLTDDGAVLPLAVTT